MGNPKVDMEAEIAERNGKSSTRSYAESATVSKIADREY